MRSSDLIIKCFAKQEQGAWVAVCLDFNLAVQGDSLSDVKRKIEDQIVFYVREALEDKEYGAQLLSRKAPLSSWMEYYYIRLCNLICRNIGTIFDETMPLRPA